MRDHFRFSYPCRPAGRQAKTALLAIALALAVLTVGCSTSAPQASAPPQATGPPHATGVPRAIAPSSATGRSRSSATLPSRATGAPQAATRSHPLAPPNVSAAQIARLPVATTYATTPTAPQDPAPFAPETGTVLHPTATHFGKSHAARRGKRRILSWSADQICAGRTRRSPVHSAPHRSRGSLIAAL